MATHLPVESQPPSDAAIDNDSCGPGEWSDFRSGACLGPTGHYLGLFVVARAFECRWRRQWTRVTLGSSRFIVMLCRGRHGTVYERYD